MSTPQRDVRLALSRIRAAVTLLQQARDMAPHDANAKACCSEALAGCLGAELYALDMAKALNEADARRAKGRKRRAA